MKHDGILISDILEWQMANLLLNSLYGTLSVHHLLTWLQICSEISLKMY